MLALFKNGKHWGAISKSNSIWLRWRDPVYASPRELAMSYFHEYVNETHKTLRRISKPFDIGKYDPDYWLTSQRQLLGHGPGNRCKPPCGLDIGSPGPQA